MKTLFLTAVVAALGTVGCAQARVQTVAELVGPAPEVSVTADHRAAGTLMVYSAFETNSLGASPFDDIRPHTAYELLSESGTLLQKIDNREGGLDEGPTAVKLAPGVYRVIARANGHGAVSVAVKVEDHRVTSVHLDGEGASIADQNKAIHLASGETIGWSAAR